MKDRMNRTKKFVKDHRVAIVGTAGVLIGAAVTYRYAQTHMGLGCRKWDIGLTKERLQELIDDPDKVLHIPTPVVQFDIHQIPDYVEMMN